MFLLRISRKLIYRLQNSKIEDLILNNCMQNRKIGFKILNKSSQKSPKRWKTKGYHQKYILFQTGGCPSKMIYHHRFH